MGNLPQEAWEIVPSTQTSTASDQLEFIDRAEAEAFLSRFKPDAAIMLQLRRLLIGSEVVSQLSDDRVIQTIASRLATGELAFKRTPPVPLKVSTGGMAPQPKPKEPAAVAASRPAPRAADPEADTFGDSHDGQAQAGALEDAAENGTAFCEECEKLRRAAA